MLRPDSLLLYCRAGFEGECAAEIQEHAANLGLAGYARTHTMSGLVTFHGIDLPPDMDLLRTIRYHDLIFSRQLTGLVASLENLPVADRVTPILEVLGGTRVGDIFVETPDTNEGKQLQAFCRKFVTPVREALKRARLYQEHDPDLPRLHLLFQGSAHVMVALSYASNASPWMMGIPRLKFPSAAPSRSTLKLDEAILYFLSATQQEQRLVPAMTAVDLGAAPGGWTYQLVRRHLRVTAVDNGALTQSLLDSGLVRHLRVDAFGYRPPKPVNWMVCDLVEQPGRVALLVADWVARGDCRDCVFNLKLPMKKRFQEVMRCDAMIREKLDASGINYSLQYKQLYHDREEITGYLHCA